MTTADTIRNLYTLIEPLGAGGMGIVYRALDRLNDRPVAIKRVVVPPELLDFMSRTRSDDYYIGLAKEFEVLASLRHPHIIAVYDYGFDEQKQPYLVMELIDSAEELTGAGEALSTEQKVDILLQMFEALDYLHRRGVIHRDLKPSNVLMNRPDGKDYLVRVLDFGLSLREGEGQIEGDTAGTINYMAPEVLEGGAASIAADLYTCGVIAWELLTGNHPFDGDSLDEMIEMILKQPLDIDQSAIPEALKPIVKRLMARQPNERYPSAWEVSTALSAVIHRTQIESAAVRESFLQAASFVGRDFEIGILEKALHQATEGKGSGWLVGGESGVGKSRLLDELRIRALVSGVQVVRGQAVEGDSSQYAMWRDVLRRLILAAEVSDLEASILKPFVADIAEMLGRPIADPAELPGDAGLRRLALTISDLLRRCPEPFLIILEDLHWAEQSHELIRQIATQLGEMRIMLVGTYRNDEAPDLTTHLEGLKVIPLGRLDADAVMKLSEKMIGEAANVPGVRELIAKETEGNVFFIVEVVRALAAESGRLQDIGRASLPAKVLSGGIEAVIRKRLERVPMVGRRLLTIAAIGGRQLEESVLRGLLKAHPDYLTGLDLERWLVACSDAAVLTIIDGQWRFAHDKLREALLADVATTDVPAFNRHLAEAIESTVTDLKPYAARLARHWRAAGVPEKEFGYVMLAGESAYLTSANLDSVAAFKRALDILDANPALEDKGRRLDATIKLARVYIRLSQYDDARTLLDEKLLVAAGNSLQAAEITAEMGRIALYQGDYGEAESRLNNSLQRYREHQSTLGAARALISLGRASIYQGRGEQAETYFRESLTTLGESADPWAKAQAMAGIAYVLMDRGEFPQAVEYLQSSLEFYRSIGNREGMAGALLDLGQVAMFQGNLSEAAVHFKQSLSSFRDIEDRWGMAAVLNNLGFIALQQEQYPEAEQRFEHSREMLQAIGDRASVANTVNNLGHVAKGRQDYPKALMYYRQSLLDALELGADPIALESLVGIASVYVQHQRDSDALELLRLATRHPATNPEIKSLAEPIVAAIKDRLTEALVTAALEQDDALDLIALGQRLLKAD